MNRKFGLIVAGAMLVAFTIITCTHKPFQPIPTPVVPPGTNPDSTSVSDSFFTDTSVCFERDVLPIFAASCAKSGCHDASTHAEELDLSTYSLIISGGIVPYNSGASRLYSICVRREMPMPPTPLLDSTQLSLIKRWIDKGAPNDTSCPAACDTSKYGYNNSIVPILKNYCYGCHATAAAHAYGGSVILDTYTGTEAQALNGKLLGTIKHAAGYSYMPLGGKKLPDCMINQVRKWIENGAQNN